MRDFMKEERSITLTEKQWSDITTLILMTTQYRKHEIEAWERRAAEKDDAGNAKYNPALEAEYLREMDESLNEIRRIIDGYKK